LHWSRPWRRRRTRRVHRGGPPHQPRGLKTPPSPERCVGCRVSTCHRGSVRKSDVDRFVEGERRGCTEQGRLASGCQHHARGFVANAPAPIATKAVLGDVRRGERLTAQRLDGVAPQSLYVHHLRQITSSASRTLSANLPDSEAAFNNVLNSCSNSSLRDPKRCGAEPDTE